ncbi:MAG: NusG domain II-containing protein [Clostridia bacterium]|nr:NusG domain II-containing protein [Clostridia bacterium]
MNSKKNTAKVRNDIIFIVTLLAISAIALIYLFVFRSSGNTVKVTVDGELIGIYYLSENITCDIQSGKNGDELNRLVIKDGKAYMESASCPDGICVAHHPVFRSGESIVCLPNKVVVTVITDSDTGSPDIVA